MKALCVNTSGWVRNNTQISVSISWWGLKKTTNITHTQNPTDGPRYGEEVTVRDKYSNGGVEYYKLVEWPDGGGYQADQFIPLEEVSEEEVEEKLLSDIYSTEL